MSREIGIGASDALLPVVLQDRVSLLLPVDAAFAKIVDGFKDETVLDVLAKEFTALWRRCYTAHQEGEERPGPFFHLGILLCMVSRTGDAVAVAKELSRCRGFVLKGASLWAAAVGRDEMRAATNHLEMVLSSHVGIEPPLDRCLAAYNLGVLQESLGNASAAREGFERALQTEFMFQPARQRLSAISLRQDCRHRMRQVMTALEDFRREKGEFPENIEVPGRLRSREPICPEDHRPYAFIVSQKRGRFLLVCRTHRLRTDSALGDLGPAERLARATVPAGLLCLRSSSVADVVKLRATVFSKRVSGAHRGSKVGGTVHADQVKQVSIVDAQREAERRGHSYIGAPHMLLGVLRSPESIVRTILQGLRVDTAVLVADVESLLDTYDRCERTNEMVFTPRAKDVIEGAFREARTIGDNYIGTEHLLLAYSVRTKDHPLGRILERHGITETELRRILTHQREVKNEIKLNRKQ